MVQNYRNTLSSLGSSKGEYNHTGQHELKLVPISNREDMNNYLKRKTVRAWRPTLIPEEDISTEESSFAFFNTAKGTFSSSLTDISIFCEDIMKNCKLPIEAIPIALLYLERLILNTGNFITESNWKKLTLAALLLAGKVISDKKVIINVPEFSLEEINELEKVFMELLEYKLHVSAGEYTKYYFILRAFAEKEKIGWNLKATPVDKLMELQRMSEQYEKNSMIS